MNIVIEEIDDRFNFKASETIWQISAMCVWKEHRSDDADDIRGPATTCKLDSKLCADQLRMWHPWLSGTSISLLILFKSNYIFQK